MKYFLSALLLLLFGCALYGFLPEKSAESSIPASTVSLEDEAGQMLIVGFRGTSVSSDSPIVAAINALNLGGIILFDEDAQEHDAPRNITSKTQVSELISDIQKFTGRHIFVSVDLEGGAVNRLKSKYGFTGFPSAETLGDRGDTAYTENIAANIGTELAETGFNMDFAPDVDVNINPNDPIIGAIGRSFSRDPEQVAAEGAAFIKGLHAEGIISVIKHFPGHGSSTADSHLGFVDITSTYEPDKELVPFQKLAASADAVMVAHVTDTNIDPNYPATLSPFFIQNMLRDQIHFGGVVISDDMSMGAITQNYTLEDAVVRAVNAGNDMLIVSNNGASPYDEQLPYEVRDSIVAAVKDGRIPVATIDAAYGRIENLKMRYNI